MRRAGRPFFLLHRPRRWNPRERVWMGRERKRGKLADLNALLRGRGGENGSRCIVGDTAALLAVRSTSSRSTPTRSCRAMRRGSWSARWRIRSIVRASTPRCNGSDRRATASCSRASATSLPSANRSRYARLFGGEPGIDPYTRAVSDVYQDLLRRRLVHRQGHLRRRRVRAGARRAVSRKPHPQPRSARGLLRALGAASDVELYEDYPARYSADVAAGTAGSAATGRSPGGCCRSVPGAGGAASSESALAAVAVEDLRQSAAQSRPAGADCCCCCWAGRAAPCRGCGRWSCSAILAAAAADRARGRAAAQARRTCRPAQHFVRFTCARARRAALSRRCFRSPAFRSRRGSALDAIVRTHVADARHAPRLLEWTPRASCDRRDRAIALVGLASVDVDRAGDRARDGRLPGCANPPALPVAAARSCCSGSLSPALAWWLSRPLRAARRAAHRRAGRLPAQARAADLGVFRDLRRAGRSLAAARQLSGASRSRARASHVADEHRPGAARESCRLRLRLRARRAADRAHRQHVATRCSRSSEHEAISTTGTTPHRCSRWRRATSRRSTAATWRGIC